MIELLKEVLGVAPEVTEFDLYLVIIGAVGALWITKSVITGIYRAVLHIFY